MWTATWMQCMSQDGGVISVGHTYLSTHLTWATKVSYTDLSVTRPTHLREKNGASGFSLASPSHFPAALAFWASGRRT